MVMTNFLLSEEDNSSDEEEQLDDGSEEDEDSSNASEDELDPDLDESKGSEDNEIDTDIEGLGVSVGVDVGVGVGEHDFGVGAETDDSDDKELLHLAKVAASAVDQLHSKVNKSGLLPRKGKKPAIPQSSNADRKRIAATVGSSSEEEHQSPMRNVGEKLGAEQKMVSVSPTLPVRHKRVSTQIMVDTAIRTLNERTGSSAIAIRKYIMNNYPHLDGPRTMMLIKKYIKQALGDGKLVQVKGIGLGGSFKMSALAIRAEEQRKKLKQKKVNDKARKQKLKEVAIKKSPTMKKSKTATKKKTTMTKKRKVAKDPETATTAAVIKLLSSPKPATASASVTAAKKKTKVKRKTKPKAKPKSKTSPAASASPSLGGSSSATTTTTGTSASTTLEAVTNSGLKKSAKRLTPKKRTAKGKENVLDAVKSASASEVEKTNITPVGSAIAATDNKKKLKSRSATTLDAQATLVKGAKKQKTPEALKLEVGSGAGGAVGIAVSAGVAALSGVVADSGVSVKMAVKKKSALQKSGGQGDAAALRIGGGDGGTTAAPPAIAAVGAGVASKTGSKSKKK